MDHWSCGGLAGDGRGRRPRCRRGNRFDSDGSTDSEREEEGGTVRGRAGEGEEMGGRGMEREEGGGDRGKNEVGREGEIILSVLPWEKNTDPHIGDRMEEERFATA